ncbi:MAG TPA: hypothetical protein VFA26_12680, partial [Gemmataceae bacterium]|nr:hypothetical protein [Gemmataceae bacterium]
MLRQGLGKLAGVARRRWRLLAALAVLAGVAGAAAPYARAWYHFRAGREALQRYHAEEARAHFAAYLRVWP